MNRYLVTYGYYSDTEILADYYVVHEGTIAFFSNDCNANQVAFFKEFYRVYLIQEDEKQQQVEKIRKELKAYTSKVNKEITIYKYVISTLILSFTILCLLK